MKPENKSQRPYRLFPARAQQAQPTQPAQTPLPREAQLLQENAMLRETLRQVHAALRMLNWSQQAGALARTYPDFDLERELQNPDFARLLCQEQASMQHAYALLHLPEIQQKLDEQRAQVEQMQVRNQRPTEGGMLSHSLPPTLQRMTATDRAQLAKRVAKGEMIRL